MIFCWLEGKAAVDKSFALILWVETESRIGSCARGLGKEGICVSGVIGVSSLTSIDELELGSGLNIEKKSES